jgi:amino acid transporter
MAVDEVTSAPQVTETATGIDNDKITTKTDATPVNKFGKKDGKRGNEQDLEKDGIGGDTPPLELQRKLKSRHLQMIAIGQSGFNVKRSRNRA